MTDISSEKAPMPARLAYLSSGVHLKVRDFELSRAFYEGVLDLVPIKRFGDAAARDRGAIYMPTPGSKIEISEGHLAVPDRAIFEQPILSPKISAMLHVASLLPLVEQKGIRPSYPIRRYPWGTIELVLKDPDGFVIVVIAQATPLEEELLRNFVVIEFR